MNGQLPSPDAQLLQALAGLDTGMSQVAVQRTRRAVMEAAYQMREAQARSRRQLGMILLVALMLVVLLTPAAWVLAEDFFSDGYFFGAPTLTMSLVLTLLSTAIAVLLVSWRDRQSRDNEEI